MLLLVIAFMACLCGWSDDKGFRWRDEGKMKDVGIVEQWVIGPHNVGTYPPPA